MAILKDYVYVRRTIDGMVMDIRRDDLDGTLKQIRWDNELNKSVPQFELAGEIDGRGAEEAPLIASAVVPTTSAFECPLCGAGFGTERGLKSHKTKNHK